MRKAIAIDFDGCLCTDAAPEIGDPNWAVINRAKAEQQAGAGLILWTCREGQTLQAALDACKSWGLAFDSINESLPDWIEAFGNNPRKVGASEYWDDKAVRIGDNPPLTLEQLREMDGEPVWITPGGFWALVIAQRGKRVRLINHEGEIVWADKEIELVGPVYRRRPED